MTDTDLPKAHWETPSSLEYLYLLIGRPRNAQTPYRPEDYWVTPFTAAVGAAEDEGRRLADATGCETLAVWPETLLHHIQQQRSTMQGQRAYPPRDDEEPGTQQMWVIFRERGSETLRAEGVTLIPEEGSRLVSDQAMENALAQWRVLHPRADVAGYLPSFLLDRLLMMCNSMHNSLQALHTLQHPFDY